MKTRRLADFDNKFTKQGYLYRQDSILENVDLNDNEHGLVVIGN